MKYEMDNTRFMKQRYQSVMRQLDDRIQLECVVARQIMEQTECSRGEALRVAARLLERDRLA